MLDNLVNADLTGLTGKIYYSYDSASMMMPQLLMSIAAIILFIGLIVIISNLVSGTKTKRYREQLVDMYVSATVRKYAKDDGLDLAEEYKTFVKESKNQRLEEKGLSKVVEEELSEKVISKQEEKLNKK